MIIVPFSEAYRQAFIDFNTDWILDYFGILEQEDVDTFDQIDRELANGAMIYFAVNERREPLACCMARPMNGERWELCKFASNKRLPHRGAGCAVFEAAIQYAASQGAKELFLLSNRKLKAALHIYEKFGFQEIKLEDYEYERGNIAFLKKLG